MKPDDWARWFCVLSSGCFVFLMIHALSEDLPHRTLKESPVALGLLAIICAFPLVLEKYLCRPLFQFTPEQLAKMRVERVADIKALRQRPVTFDEAVRLLEGGQPFSGTIRIRWNSVLQFEQWYASADTIDTELWLYDNGVEAWENLHGEWGFAIVRGDEIIDFLMIEHN